MALKVIYKGDIKNHAAGLMYSVDEFASFIKDELATARHQGKGVDPDELQTKIDAWYSGYKAALASNAITFGV